MEKFTLTKPGGQKISCMKLIPPDPEEIVIMVHGFGSSMDCDTGMLLFRRMPPENIGVVTYDQPAHGTSESRSDSLGIENCLDSLETVEKYLVSEYPDAKIYYFSSSFGAYLTLLYISRRSHTGCKAFLRSAAVNMPQLLLKGPHGPSDPQAAAQLSEKGYCDIRDLGPSPIRVPASCYDELKENDLVEKYSERRWNDTAVEMVHGEKDSIIELARANDFASRFGIPITVFPEEEHTLSDLPETPDKVADLAIAFFRR